MMTGARSMSDNVDWALVLQLHIIWLGGLPLVFTYAISDIFSSCIPLNRGQNSAEQTNTDKKNKGPAMQGINRVPGPLGPCQIRVEQDFDVVMKKNENYVK